MFKRKTFHLVNEEEAKKREKLYEPMRCRWMKYIVIPALIGFILLLILMNVDFSDKTKTTAAPAVSTIATTITGIEFQTTIVAETTLLPMLSEQRARSYNLPLNNGKQITGAAFCKDQGGDRCTVLCSNGNVNFLADDLEDLSYSCSDDLDVILDNCTFPSQELTKVVFKGFFILKSLEIINCDLVEIVDEAFNIPSMSRLLKLNLNTIAMIKLTEKSFKGLTALHELKYFNVPSSSKFVGAKFLQPLARTLQNVSLCQKSDTTVYDPLSWLDGNEEYSRVTRVNLTGNNFSNTLSQATFSNLPAVRELILANCSITELDVNTFSEIMTSLKYLDLSSNALTSLNVSVLARINGLRLELYGNAWSCTCDNHELIKALQAAQFTYVNEPLCKTPSQWVDKPLKEVTLKCGEGPPTTQEPPSSPTTSPVETTSTSPSTTTVTTTSPDETPTSSSETTPSTTKTTVTTTSPDETPTPSSETTTSTTKNTVTTTSPDETPTSSSELTSSTTKTTVTTTNPDETPTPPLETTPSTNSSTVAATSPNETSSSISESVKTTETETSETDTPTTTATTNQTSNPPKPTPPKPPIPEPIELVCKNLQDAATPKNYTISIRGFDARFTVRPTSPSSVVLLISNNMQHLSLIYFTANNRTYANTTEKNYARNIPDCHCHRTSTAFTIIHVESLVSNQTYIFCLMPLEEHTISPFNCQSYHMEAETSGDSTAWLLVSDQAWFFIIIIFSIALTVCLGLISVYWLLRWRPTWLRGCKRIIKADDFSHEVYLFPKPQRKSSEQGDSDYANNGNHDGIHSNLNLDFDSHDYMQFYKNLQDANRNRKIHTLSSNLPPKEQAPAVPKIQSRTVSLQSTIAADDLIEHCDADDGNDYQSIDYYEQLF